MAKREPLYKWRIKQKGIFNFAEMYNSSKDWLRDEGYKVIEQTYTEEIIGDSKKLEIRWEATRKISDYYKFVIVINWLVLNLKNVFVQKHGEVVKMNSGEPEITIKAIIIKDYEHRWEMSFFQKFLRGIYDKYIVKSRFDEYKLKLASECEEFNKYLKSFLSSSGTS